MLSVNRRVGILETIHSPADLKALDPARLSELATEVRAFLVEQTSRTGGHLSPNLGVVELTFALHRVFDSPSDAIVWDTGHQAYVHKLVTGRANGRTLHPTSSRPTRSRKRRRESLSATTSRSRSSGRPS